MLILPDLQSPIRPKNQSHNVTLKNCVFFSSNQHSEKIFKIDFVSVIRKYNGFCIFFVHYNCFYILIA